MTKIKKILIFLSAVLLVIAGNKKNSDFAAKNKEKNNKEILEQEKSTEAGNNNGKVTTEPDEKEIWDKAVEGVDYLCFDLYMRMQNPRKIYITKDSVLTPRQDLIFREVNLN